MEADNEKESKGALLILLRKYDIRAVNGALSYSQTRGLIEQPKSLIKSKIRGRKMDNGSSQWANCLLEIKIAIDTQKNSTIGCTSRVTF